jgi:ABC-type amino acid transport substrate-binding protein
MMNHKTRWILGVAACVLAAAGAQADLLEDAKESGEITIGIANEAPYGYQTPCWARWGSRTSRR